MRFDLSDIVRVQQLTVPTREVDGPGADPPQPRVGELGVVVDLLGDDMYLVEHTTDDGRLVWTAELLAAELLLVRRGDA